MKFSIAVAVSALAASAAAQIDPLTVTSLSPAQSSAFVVAEESLIASLTADPGFTSVIMELATDTSALDAFTSAAGALTAQLPTGSAARDAVNSLISVLPPAAQSYVSNVFNAEIAIASSIVNNGAITSSGSGSGTDSTTTKSLATSASKALSSAVSAATGSASGSGAQPTAYAKVAGVAVGVFGAAVAML